MNQQPPLLPWHAGVNTHQEHVIYLRQDCPVSRSEGFNAQSRVHVSSGASSIIASLHFVSADWLPEHHVGLSDAAWQALQPEPGRPLTLRHPPQVQSMSAVRGKLYGQRLQPAELTRLMRDIVAGHLTDVEIAAFIACCGGNNLDQQEVLALTQAMIDAGARMRWPVPLVVDKHCVGGLPGNRTTPIVVAIMAACGLTIPKTSSRAITSPAGTADTMETLTRVTLSMDEMRTVVEQQQGCLVWGGAVHLSPGDDILIRIERALDIDSPAQLVASVLSKKAAAGATHVLIDIPVGDTAKVRSQDDAEQLASLLVRTGQQIGLHVQTLITDGSQPVGHGIGPALEAHDVLAVLQNQPHAPQALRQRALQLAAAMLELAAHCPAGEGLAEATQVLDSGTAWQRFIAICEAQGGRKQPPRARLVHPVYPSRAGQILAIDNRRLSKLAKLAGAPAAAAAGIYVNGFIGDQANPETPLFELHAESQGELDYALAYLHGNPDIYRLDSDHADPAQGEQP